MSTCIGEIENIIWNKGPNRVYFNGYAFIEGINIDKPNKVKKSLIISDGVKKFFIPVNNVLNSKITEKLGENEYNYDFSGFEGFIDLGFINDMGPISQGEWKIGLYINADGEEIEHNIKYNNYLGEEEPKELHTQKSSKKNIVYLTRNSENEIVLKVKDYYVPLTEKLKGSKAVRNIVHFTKKHKRKLGNSTIVLLYNIFNKLNVKHNRVTFLSDSRIDFSGNFEFIYKELKDRGGYDIRSILKPSISAKRTLKDKINLIYYLSTSKYILLDDYYPQIYKFKIKNDIEVVQLWHATGAFKTFGFSRLGKTGGPKVRSKNHRNYTKAIVSSNSIKKHYAEAFGISENRVIATGVPRTDIFFDEAYKENKVEEIYLKYPLLKDKKVIMFAPTFRGHGQKSAHYDFSKLNIDELYTNLSEEYIIIMKLHPFIKNIPIINSKYKDFIIDLSAEREINDLLFVADILITDYSSVCFEYSLLNRPMIFFAYDLEEYIESRDFYYPYESFVPGPIARTTEDIVDIIKNGKYEHKKLAKFRLRFFDHFDGDSTKRVVDYLLNIDKK